MSVLYLMRHGQASFGGEIYDQLSELGRRQAELTGQHLQALDLRFNAAYCGAMARQQDTARAVLEQMDAPPDLEVMPEFNEYDSAAIINALAPAMIEKDPAVADALPNIFQDRRAFQLVYEGAMRLWVTGRHSIGSAETWQSFLLRVQQGLMQVQEKNPRGRKVLVFTSGGPISVIMRQALALSDQIALALTLMIKNASLSSFLYSGGDLSLSTFNSTAHLDGQDDAGLITYR